MNGREDILWLALQECDRHLRESRDALERLNEEMLGLRETVDSRIFHEQSLDQNKSELLYVLRSQIEENRSMLTGLLQMRGELHSETRAVHQSLKGARAEIADLELKFGQMEGELKEATEGMNKCTVEGAEKSGESSGQ